MATLTATRPKPMAPGLKMRPAARTKAHVSLPMQISRSLMRRPRRTLMIGLGMAAATTIILNALFFQQARHPAPLMSSSRQSESAAAHATPAQATDVRSVAAPAVAPPARPANLETASRETASVKPVAATSASAVRPASREVPRDTSPRDPIAELIMNGDVRPPADVGRNDSRKSVTMAQKALNKLGYGVTRVDGRLDEPMRMVLEQFEKDRKIPVTRDLSPRTSRELTAASGIRIE